MKLTRLRNFAMLLMFVAFLIMYASTFGRLNPATKFLLPVGLVIGIFVAIIAMFMYFRIGAISMRLPQVDCPRCGRSFKLLGSSDHCPKCRTNLRLVDNGEGRIRAEVLD